MSGAKNILITGASGLIGTCLTEMLVQRGHRVSHVSRTKKAGIVPVFRWDIGLGIIDPKAIASTEVIVHLAGAGIADARWTAKRKSEILESRVRSTALLFSALKKGNHPVKTFISASAIGYYGFGESEVFTEADLPGNDFLAQVTAQWEAEADKISSLGLRVVKVRTGIVLSAKGGALKSMASPIKWGLGAAIGPGSQYLSWIHIVDLCRIFCKSLEEAEMTGPYNAVSQQPVTNVEMTHAIAKVLKRPLWLPPVPPFVMKVLLGEMADIVIHGNKVSPEKIIHTGFKFEFSDLENALNNLYPSY